MSPLIVLFVALAAQASPTKPPEEPYTKIELSEPDVRAATKAALATVKGKGTLISAERHAISGDNIRLCISMNRSPSYEFARIVLTRDAAKKRWNVTTWSWGSCGR